MPDTFNKRAFSIRAQQDGVTRQETFMGREYTVVPVVALVEGVVQGMLAEVPELALAEEFGKVPEGWDGRPVVMNHPVINNKPCSANSPAALEAFQMGMLFNTRVEDKKLKTEAWLDNTRIEELGGEFQSTLDRVNDGTVIEVSTGLFTGIEETSGRFNERDYKAVWRDVVPDHLAFLSEGTIGACSIEDGCGTPRTNQTTNSTLKASSAAARWQECGCKHGGATVPDTPPTVTQINNGPNAVVVPTVKPEFNLSRILLSTQSAPADMVDADVRNLVNQALNLSEDRYVYIIGLTREKVIYETYNYDSGAFLTYQRSFTINDSKEVSFGDDTERVVVTMQVTPVKDTNDASPKANSGEPEMPDTPAPVAPVVETPAVTTPEVVTPPAPAPVQNAAPVVATPRTLAQYIAEAPSEIQAVLNTGVRMHNEQKQSIIKTLKATNRCTFDDTQLNAMSLDVLESLAKLAQVPDYGGQNPAPRELNTNSSFAPAMPALIPAKSA